MSWPPRGIDPKLNEKLRKVYADSERAQESILSVDKDVNRLRDELALRVSKSLSVADLLPEAERLINAAKAARQPDYVDNASLLQGEILLAMNRPEEALSGLNAARAELAGALASSNPTRRHTDVWFLKTIAQA